MPSRTALQRYALEANRRFGWLFPASLRQRVARRLFPPRPPRPPDARKRVEILVDVVGSCNLRCPSCPVGNMGLSNGTGLLDKDLFSRIMEKAAREYNVVLVSLFNWAEPMLHPDLPSFIRIVKGYDIPCAISTNLNVLRNIDEVLRAGPDEFRISLSGYTQEVYGHTHVGGNIERVKSNMVKVAEAKRRTMSRETYIYVYYHKYLHNLSDIASMKSFSEQLGFGWLENWAYYMPIENMVRLAEGRLEPNELAFVNDTFALPIHKALKAAERYRHEPCRLLEEQIVLDLKGNLLLCCGVYDYANNTLGSFLDMTPSDVERAKQYHSTCDSCMAHGIHRYFEYYWHPELRATYDELSAENLKMREGRTCLPVIQNANP